MQWFPYRMGVGGARHCVPRDMRIEWRLYMHWEKREASQRPEKGVCVSQMRPCIASNRGVGRRGEIAKYGIVVGTRTKGYCPFQRGRGRGNGHAGRWQMADGTEGLGWTPTVPGNGKGAWLCSVQARFEPRRNTSWPWWRFVAVDAVDAVGDSGRRWLQRHSFLFHRR